TTLFNALTHSQAQTSAYGSAGDEPNVAMVKVPDGRLDVLAAMFKPRKLTPADVQYVDVAGLAPGDDPAAARTQGLSRKFLGAVAANDALLIVVRAFESASLLHPAGTVDPGRDLETVALELIFSDLGIIERRMARIKAEFNKMRPAERELQERELALLERIQPELEQNRPIRALALSDDEQKLVKNYQFLSNKPWLIVVNLGESNLDAGPALVAAVQRAWPDPGAAAVAACAQLEMEVAQLPDADAAEFRESLGLGPSPLGTVITRSYDLLGLISFLTAGEDEVRAWTIRRGTPAQQAAGAIHSDLERGFIRAEVVTYDDLIAAGSMAEAKKRGTVRMEGKTYPVKDGDILHILFNV
ncbi:MAG TPA: redox-regulated ATPase YchF, partial [Chloroflexia bacterium]|nr:redox-regulated ATPase YchF [Chloroflexia bacterium]